MLKRILSHIPILYRTSSILKRKWIKFQHRHDASIISSSPYLVVNKDVIGGGNSIEVKEATVGTLKIRIRGFHNTITIGSNCHFGPECSLWIEGNNSSISIGNNTTMTMRVHLNCQENSRSIIIGEDCMLSNNIIIRTSDSHPIYDRKTECRINHAKDIKIDNHVWIAPNTKIMKGAVIGEGAIIGSDTTISKSVEPYSLVVGRPQKVVKSDVCWTREALF